MILAVIPTNYQITLKTPCYWAKDNSLISWKGNCQSVAYKALQDQKTFQINFTRISVYSSKNSMDIHRIRISENKLHRLKECSPSKYLQHVLITDENLSSLNRKYRTNQAVVLTYQMHLKTNKQTVLYAVLLKLPDVWGGVIFRWEDFGSLFF